jgi:hypothetical protein
VHGVRGGAGVDREDAVMRVVLIAALLLFVFPSSDASPPAGIWISEFDARCDGQKDDTPSIQSAIDTAIKYHPHIVILRGRHGTICKINKPLNINQAYDVILRGR